MTPFAKRRKDLVALAYHTHSNGMYDAKFLIVMLIIPGVLLAELSKLFKFNYNFHKQETQNWTERCLLTATDTLYQLQLIPHNI